jgi:PKD repeat protein
VAHWDFGDGQSSTQNNPTHVYNNAGTYNAKLVVSNGCGTDSTTQVVNIVCVQPVASYATSQQGLSVDFVSTSTNAPNVIWNFGDGTGISILPVVSHTFMTTGIYNVCLTASNGCGSNTYCSVISVCTPPTANFTHTDSVLTSNFTSTSLNGTDFLWNFGDSSVTNLENPSHVFANSGTHTVCVTVSNSCGFSSACKTITSYCSYFMNQQICLVTVDSTSTNNIIYWDKSNIVGLDSFIVYREVTSGIYKRIGAVSKDSMSMFIDTVRSVGPANGNPNVGTYRYKLQARDSCGNFGPKSPYHNTVFFVDNQSGVFTWNKYLIEGQANTPITQFNLLRDNANNGIWSNIGTVAGTQTTLSDPLYATYQSIANWRVEALGFSCNPTLRINPYSTQGTVVKSKSNISNNRQVGVSTVTLNNDLMLYPNPSNSTVVIEGTAALGHLSVFNSVGAEIYSGMIQDNKHMIDVSQMSNGIYFVQLRNNGATLTRKFTVQH